MRAPLHRRPRRLLIAALAMSGLAVGSVVAPGAPLTGRAEAAGRTYTVYPGVNLRSALMELRPGDTLQLAPGVYRTGFVLPIPATANVRTKMSVGTPTAPITVRAQDPRNRPLILGEIKLWGPSYWHLDGLRIQGVDAGKDTLYMAGGVGWVVRNSEIFGARQTGAYSNVTIGSDIYGTGAPRGFNFTSNCVHDAGQTKRSNTDHNIYVSFTGNSSSGGWISRNVIFGHPNGVGVKLGAGGVPGARGPWGVKVVYNTIARGGRQVLLHGDVRNNYIARNIFANSWVPLGTTNKTTSVYLNLVIGGGNTFANNYATASTMFSFGKTARFTTDNAVRPNPKFNNASCGGFRTSYPKASAYGKYGSGAMPRW